MRIVSVKQKGLQRLMEADDACGLPAHFVGRLRNILAFLQNSYDIAQTRKRAADIDRLQ